MKKEKMLFTIPGKLRQDLEKIADDGYFRDKTEVVTTALREFVGRYWEKNNPKVKKK